MGSMLDLQSLEASSDAIDPRASGASFMCNGDNSSVSLWCGCKDRWACFRMPGNCRKGRDSSMSAWIDARGIEKSLSCTAKEKRLRKNRVLNGLTFG